MRDPVGTTIGNGRYRVLQRLGAGGMGTVYRGVHLDLGTAVAIKALGSHENTAERARFRQEARAAASLDHPGCVRVTDFGEMPGGEPYFVMELLEGPTVRQLMDRGRVTLTKAIDTTLAVLDALAYAHRHGILHRDVKPSNVMFGRRCDVMVPILIDFGLAKPVDLPDEPSNQFCTTMKIPTLRAPGDTAPGVCCGSPSYLAPERLRGQPYGPSADVYSVGVMFYELLTGEKPFTGRSPGGIALQALHRHPPAVSAIAPHVPAAFDDVVARAIEKDPRQRFANPIEMGLAISQAAMGIEASGPLDIAVERTDRVLASTAATSAA